MRSLRLMLVSLFALLTVLALPACSTIARLGDNPVVVRLAVSQAVARYIESGDSPAEPQDRRAEVLAVMGVTLNYIGEGVNASVYDVFDVFVDQINLDSMTRADQLLARETIALVQQSLQRRVESGELPDDTVIVLRSIVQTAIDAANYL